MLTSILFLSLAQPRAFDSLVAWERVSEEGGLALEQRRPEESSGFVEYRVTTRTPLAVGTLCQTTFEWGTRGTVPGLSHRKELSSAPDERVVYDQFQLRLVSNRDYAITVRRWRGSDGTCRIRYWATNEKAPRLLEGWVRMEKLWGGWTFTPHHGPAGAYTELVYTQFSDPGGSVPAAFANGTQRDAALQSVRAALQQGKAGVK